MATVIKVIVTGDSCAGKSQVIKQFISGRFVEGYDPTELNNQENRLEDEEWFHGVLLRKESQRLLANNGDFLVRESKNKTTNETQFVLSAYWQGYRHFIMQFHEGGWRFEGKCYPTIPELVRHQWQCGEPVTNKSQTILANPIVRKSWELNNDDVVLEKKIGNIGDSYRKQMKVGSTYVLLDILDTAGHEEYSAIRDQYIRTADVVIIMYSVTNIGSFTTIGQYHDHIRRVKDSDSAPFILVGTKIHKRNTRVQILEPEKHGSKKIEQISYVTFNNGLKMASDIKAQGFFECSAKTREGIDDVFRRAAEVGLQYVQNKGKYFDNETSGLHSMLLQVTKSSPNLFNEILKQGTEENYDIRVMLVGRADVGKTTLTRRLLRLPVNLKKYDSTSGVDVHIDTCDIQLDSGTWVIKEKERSLKKMKKKLMDLWDKRIKRHEETAKKTKSRGSRNFHLRCAKLLQKFQESGFEELKETPKVSSSQSASDSGISQQSQTDETSDDENQTTVKQLDMEYPSDRGLRGVLSKSAKSTGPIHKTVDNSDVEQTLQQAKALPKEKANRFAKVSLYDFAGQYIFHASHPTFLSPQAIYILVFDLTKLIEWKGKKRKVKKSLHNDEEQYFGDCRGNGALEDRESIFFWLNLIYLFAALKQNIKPQVILVGTHYDKLPKPERDTMIEKFLRELRCELASTPLKELVSYDFIVDNSKKEDDKFSAIKEEIFRLAKLQPDWGKKTPSKWLPLERELQCLKESGLKVLWLDELRDINGGLDLQVDSDAEMEMFLEFLHDAGEIIFFRDPELKDYIVLDPVWLIDALKLVITSDRFTVRIPKLAEKWVDFCKTGVIYKSTIVGIFEERTEDPTLYENYEHVLRLMEKFQFIAAPQQFPEEMTKTNNVSEEVDTCYIMTCMIHKEIDTQLITNVEGTCRTSVLCLVAINRFLPPVIFQKLLAMCIKKWPIVEQNGQKLIFCGVCKFNLDSTRNYKLTVFQVGYAIHARITSYSKEENTLENVAGSVFEFLVQCLKSILKGLRFSEKFKTCMQCPGFSPLENGGYIDTDIAEGQDTVTCDDCEISHSLQTDEILMGWIRREPKEKEAPMARFCGDSSLTDASQSTALSNESVRVKLDEPEDVTQVEDSSDIADGPITQEHFNHARLCNVLVTVCADGLREILLSQLPQGCPDFHHLLIAKEIQLRGMRQLRQEQLGILYPDLQNLYTGTVDQFDITLLYLLIRNISAVVPPGTGWGQPPDDNPRDTSLGANVERIRRFRNVVVGHSVDYTVDEQTFEDTWKEISHTMDDIEKVIGDKEYTMALRERKTQAFTLKQAGLLQRKFKDDIISAVKGLDQIKTTVKDLDQIMKKLTPITDDT